MFQVSIFLLIGIITFGYKIDNVQSNEGTLHDLISNTSIVPIDISEVPYIAYVLIQKPQGLVGCMGSLISKHFLIAKATCVKNGGKYSVRIGSSNKKEGGIVVDIDKNRVILHPEHNKVEKDFDLAIIKLPEYDSSKIPVKFLKVPGSEVLLSGSGHIFGVGWALTNDRSDFVLKAVHTTIGEDGICANRPSLQKMKSNICFSSIGNKPCPKLTWSVLVAKEIVETIISGLGSGAIIPTLNVFGKGRSATSVGIAIEDDLDDIVIARIGVEDNAITLGQNIKKQKIIPEDVCPYLDWKALERIDAVQKWVKLTTGI